jgi:cytochrome c
LTVARCFIVPLAAALALSAGAASAAGDSAKGFQIFKGTCGVCHLARNDMSTNDAATKIGPNLYGVVGRKAGSVPHFRYSAAMHDSGVVWTADMLRRYAHEPQKTIPNVRMSFPGLPNQKDADDVVAYLGTLNQSAHK